MGLTNEHVVPKILAKIKIYVLTRAELLFTLCYEIPCMFWKFAMWLQHNKLAGKSIISSALLPILDGSD